MKPIARAILRTTGLALSVAAVAMFTSPADAHRAQLHSGAKAHAAKVRYGGKPGRGYWRPGPERGYGFRFATYKGDPFGADDYYDGDRCYYVHKRNSCAHNRIFNGFWDRPAAR